LVSCLFNKVEMAILREPQINVFKSRLYLIGSICIKLVEDQVGLSHITTLVSLYGTVTPS
jgi:hypothetical protein